MSTFNDNDYDPWWFARWLFAFLDWLDKVFNKNPVPLIWTEQDITRAVCDDKLLAKVELKFRDYIHSTGVWSKQDIMVWQIDEDDIFTCLRKCNMDLWRAAKRFSYYRYYFTISEILVMRYGINQDIVADMMKEHKADISKSFDMRLECEMVVGTLIRMRWAEER